ncbi:hypothetical protein B9N43_08795 [Denitratisoma sp. DHT3]|uniref:flagellar protein FlaG n=1 Tax=Denitratisoma sp. DHT3 TaxID=1981880 RepID=UPI0011988FA5|nr:flagellar protein FlaG [Denitratisoma sp. DHT3]QDX81330.1 hypothetical protein B9N43_08795 [Denitratisoma sp. DHT3]
MALNTISSPGGANVASLPAAPVAPGGAPAAAVKAPAVVSESQPQQQSKPEQLQKALAAMKQLVEAKAPNSLSFSIDDESGKTIVKVSDAQTGEMIRQIPSEEMLELARSLDKLQGALLRQEA